MHGTTQGPAGWARLAEALRRRGHTVTPVDLPPGQAAWSVGDYAAEAAAQAGQPAGRRVVVGHSGAGVLLPAIAEATGSAAAVWLAAYIPDLAGGQSMAGGPGLGSSRVLLASGRLRGGRRSGGGRR